VARALDLGCGTGAALRILRPLCRRLVVGVDFSLGLLAEARASGGRPREDLVPSSAAAATINSELGPVAVAWLQQDLLSLGARPAFELATIFGALGHFRPAVQARFLAEVRSCLVPGGRLALVTAPLPPPWSPALWLAAAFDTAMWVRNRLWRPPFVMYYLAWPLGRTRRLLRDAGFGVEIIPLASGSGPPNSPQLAYPLSRLLLVLARRE
jgi:SAM-dependent methyltransferase